MFNSYLTKHVLYENSEGSNSNIDLSDLYTKYEEIEIEGYILFSSYEYTKSSIYEKFRPADTNNVTLKSMNFQNNSQLNIRYGTLTFDNKKITHNNERYANLSNTVNIGVSSSCIFYITKVIGYK